MIRTEMIAPIATLLERRATRNPDKVGFSDARRAVTYAELNTLTRTLAGQLRDAGLKDGDAVAIWLPNCVEWVIACLAIVRAGGVAVPVANESAEGEVLYRLEDSRSVMVVVTAERAAIMDRIDASLPNPPRRVYLGGKAVGLPGMDLDTLCTTPPQTTDLPVDDINRVAYIVYTSGTTGRPKGVQLCTRALLWSTAACWAPILGYCEDDHVLSPLPLFHSFALTIAVLSPIATGAHVHLMDKFSSPVALDLLRSGKFTFMPGVPTMFHYLLLAAEGQDDNPFAGVRLCVTAGAIMQASLCERFEDRFGIELLDSYGITEMSTMVTMNWPGGPREPGSCGLPIPGMALRVIDPATGLDVPFGQEGELICRGPNIMIGYNNMPEQTAQVIRDGWYHTGDLARFDDNGFITITGRLKEIIIRGGQNIAPAEIEEVLMQHPGVKDCAVIGLPHQHLGEVPAAFVVTRDGGDADAASIRAHCAVHLSAYKVPEQVIATPDIPRTGSGKIMRFRLRERVIPAEPA